jgi:aminotransferase
MRFADRVANLHHSDIRRWTRIVEEVGGVNLAQGICQVEPRPEVVASVEAAHRAMRTGLEKVGYNTYTHYSGIDPLREAIAAKAREYNRIDADPDPYDGHIVVTAGATGAFACLFDAVINDGDEVILFEPFYGYHLKSLALRGGVPRFVPLRPPDWSFDPADLRARLSRRTRAVLINTPSNPSGKVFTRQELGVIADFCTENDLLAVTDEVYEYMLYDGAEHVSPATLPGMAERTVTVTSFSKTLAITGWRLGYAIAPRPLAKKISLVNEFSYACAPSPLQHGIVDAVRNHSQFRTLRDFYAPKRDLLADTLEAVGFRVSRPRGAYYIMADYTGLGFADDVAAVEGLIRGVGVGAVPGSAFYSGDRGKNLVRFCFAFNDAGLQDACGRLRRMPARGRM